MNNKYGATSKSKITLILPQGELIGVAAISSVQT
jgi:hypothetical protein